MVGSRDHRTQFWKRAIQRLFYQSLVAIGPVVSEKITMMATKLKIEKRGDKFKKKNLFLCNY
jgi:hypothetical protein